MSTDEAQRWANDFLSEGPAISRDSGGMHSFRVDVDLGYAESVASGIDGVPFSPFIIEHAEQARELSRVLMIAARTGGQSAVEEAAAALRAEHDPALVKFAVKLYITHSKQADGVRISALETRAPQKVVPSPTDLSVKTGEALLNWWREDPEVNEHHDHWHVVYPSTGIADPTDTDPQRTRELHRHGELFFYMHEQMLARYDHERIAVGLDLVEPLSDYESPIAEGYDPTEGLKDFPDAWWQGQEFPSARPDGATLPETLPGSNPGTSIPRTRFAELHDKLSEVAISGKMLNEAGDLFDIGIDELGRATEPSLAPKEITDRSRVPDSATYKSFHGLGHNFIGRIQGDAVPPGVMYDTDTAIRDPAFYRWHRHVDDLGFRWQEGQPPHDLTKYAGGVRIRKSAQENSARPAESADLILIEEDDELAVLSNEDVKDLLRAKLAAANWDVDFSASKPGTDTLHTQMFERNLVLEPPTAKPVTVKYLDQRPFAYAVRMHNTQPHDHHVTVRLFFVADELFGQRRMWIELDKFKHHVAGERSIAVRRASESSVIRHPGTKPPGPTRHADAGDGAPVWGAKAYCDCGWPYNLLLPRSTHDGMKFWLAAVVTDWATDQVPSECGSMSYCGAKDRYPDKKPMGYPFDRPIDGAGIARALSEQPHMAARSFQIVWVRA